MREPKRLRDSDELPRSLREALRSLQRQAPTTDAVARVERVLEELPASPAAHSAVSFGAGSFKTLTISVVTTLAAVSAIVLPMHWTGTLPPPRAPDAPALSPQEDPADADAKQPSAHSEPQAQPRGAAEDASRSVLRRVREEPTRRAQARVKGPAAASEGVARIEPRSQAVPSHLETRPDAQPASNPQREAPAAPPESNVHSRPPARPSAGVVSGDGALATGEPTDTERFTSDSEARLLYRAKSLAARAPEEALGVIAVLAERFPRGALAQEREVLAIQLHARLGHSTTVQRKIVEFRARFPNSVYVRSLSAISP